MSRGNVAALIVAVHAVHAVLPITIARAEEVIEDSVQWRTCDSELVIRGKVTSVVNDAGKFHAVTVRVEETLKGNALPELELRWRGPADRFAPGWKGVLFLVQDATAPYQQAFRLRTPEAPAQAFYRLPLQKEARRLAFHSNMRRIESAEALAAAVRGRVLRGSCAGARRLLPAPPPSDAFRLLTRDSTVDIAVPADEAEQARATAEADALEAMRPAGACGACAMQPHARGPAAAWLVVLLWFVAPPARARRVS